MTERISMVNNRAAAAKEVVNNMIDSDVRLSREMLNVHARRDGDCSPDKED